VRRKCSTTLRELALEWLFSIVNALMRFQVALLCETLATSKLRANERLQTGLQQLFKVRQQPRITV